MEVLSAFQKEFATEKKTDDSNATEPVLEVKFMRVRHSAYI